MSGNGDGVADGSGLVVGGVSAAGVVSALELGAGTESAAGVVCGMVSGSGVASVGGACTKSARWPFSSFRTPLIVAWAPMWDAIQVRSETLGRDIPQIGFPFRMTMSDGTDAFAIHRGPPGVGEANDVYRPPGGGSRHVDVR